MTEIFITTSKRGKWCLNLLNDIKEQGKGHDYNVRLIHDTCGSDYSKVKQFCQANSNFEYKETKEHYGKEGYWMLNNILYMIAETLDYDYIVQIPDDCLLVDNFFKRVTGLINEDVKVCSFSTTNIHQKTFLGHSVVKYNGVEYWHNNWGDCCFVSTKKNIDGLRIGKPVIKNKTRGSGVAHKFIKAINERGIRIYQTKYALYEHIGAFETAMHYKERATELYGIEQMKSIEYKKDIAHPLLNNLCESDKDYIETKINKLIRKGKI